MKPREPVLKTSKAIPLISRISKKLFLVIPIKYMSGTPSFMCYVYEVASHRWNPSLIASEFYSILKSLKLEHKKKALMEMFDPEGPFVMLQRR